MNKNKKGQIDLRIILSIIGIILFLVIGIPILTNAMQAVSCQQEKQIIESLKQESELKDSLLNEEKMKNINLQDLLDSCNNSLNMSHQECQNRITQIKEEYNLKFEETEIVMYFKQKIKILMFLFLIPLSLFSIKIKFTEKHEMILFLFKSLLLVGYLAILFTKYEEFFDLFF